MLFHCSELATDVSSPNIEGIYESQVCTSEILQSLKRVHHSINNSC